MKTLTYTDAATEDLQSIEWYLQDVSGWDVATTVTDGVRAQCRKLASLPGTLGTDRSELRPGLRSTPHRNYIIFFRYSVDAVEIVNILHGNRDIGRFYDSG